MASKLTQEIVKSLLYYDPLTGLFIRKVRTSSTARVGGFAGCEDAYGYIQIGVGGELVKAHRLAWFYMTGEWPPEDIDHVNGDRRDNRWANLRLASRAENLMNTCIRSDNTSGHKGVGWAKREQLWRAYININGKTKSLGYFKELDEAIKARKDAERLYHGEFARK